VADPTAIGDFDAAAFDAYEAAGWDARSDPYDAFWAPITVRAADAVLVAAGVQAGRLGTRLLDVGCGTGRVSARAASLGALVTGLDVAPSMVAAASALVPEGSFVVGSADALPFDDGAFDAVVANVVLLHVGRQDVALAEMARVLRPGGGLGVTMWDEGAGNALHAVLLAAVADVGVTPPADLPPGPPAFYLDDEFSALVAAAGFASVAVSHLRFTVAFPDVEAMWSGMLRAGVRFPPLVNAQPPDVRAAIRAAFERRLAPYAVDGGLEVPTSIQVTAARR
jgi:SAM-dependent methyltransferase